MQSEKGNPVTIALADRVQASALVSREEVPNLSERTRERQARYILKFYEVSLPVALVIAEHAYDSGRGT